MVKVSVNTHFNETVVAPLYLLAVQRHLRIAEQYIANVARGKFPLRDGR